MSEADSEDEHLGWGSSQRRRPQNQSRPSRQRHALGSAANRMRAEVAAGLHGSLGGEGNDGVVHIIRPHNGSQPRILDKPTLKKVRRLGAFECS